MFTNKSRKFRFEDADNKDQELSTAGDHTDSELESEKQSENIDIQKQGSRSFGPFMPPPFVSSNFPEINSESEAHASMLMSWYMAGYHTGYYEAMKRSKKVD